jgi:antitoxin (DNA-binding transcriptional repressor) of toxin-antitoxin stability system
LEGKFALDELAVVALIAEFRAVDFDNADAAVDQGFELHGFNRVYRGGTKKTNLGLMTVNVHEAQAQLSRLLDLLEQGEDIVILRHGKAVARLVRAKAAAKPQLGAMKGEITWTEGWERAMSDEEAEAFWEGR